MKKQGFTLIELMVVIVIMGILAAVAVPKLFGMIAKSKASEVGPAAGTYVKLQQAYVSEAANIGDWSQIGYAAPGTNGTTSNFAYSQPTTGWKDNTVELASGMEDAWGASNITKLNDCAQGKNWTVSVAAGTSGSASGEAIFTAAVATTNGDCKALTPNFENIGK